MASTFAQDGFNFTPEMKKALAFSVLLHVGIVGFGIVGLPYVSKPPPVPQPIAIEIIDAGDITTTKQKPPEKTLRPVVKEPKKAEKAEETIKAPPKVVAKEPPKINPIEKPVVKKEIVKPEPIKKTPPPEPIKKVEKPKPPEKPKPEPKKEVVKEKPKPKPPEKKKIEPKKEDLAAQEDAFQSLLKNEAEPKTASTEMGLDKITESLLDAPVSDNITQSELGALTNQLVGCWQIPIGVKDVGNMVVYIHIWANPDSTVKRVEVKDKWRMNSDSAYRSLAESAKRAVLDPACSPLKLPQGKHQLWKDQYIEVPFDPSYVT